MPLAVGDGDQLGTLWVVADAKDHFDAGDAQAVADLAVFVGMALLVGKREEQSRRALEEQETVAQEMSHRLKNLFAVTDGMIRGSARNAQSPAAMADALSGRLHALASAHSLVRRKVSDSGAILDEKDLGDLIRAVVSAHEAGYEREPISSARRSNCQCGQSRMRCRRFRTDGGRPKCPLSTHSGHLAQCLLSTQNGH